jgi:hypothetical protein
MYACGLPPYCCVCQSGRTYPQMDARSERVRTASAPRNKSPVRAIVSLPTSAASQSTAVSKVARASRFAPTGRPPSASNSHIPAPTIRAAGFCFAVGGLRKRTGLKSKALAGSSSRSFARAHGFATMGETRSSTGMCLRPPLLALAICRPLRLHPGALIAGELEHTVIVRVIHEVRDWIKSRSTLALARVAIDGTPKSG